jgi:hypothetical protein
VTLVRWIRVLRRRKRLRDPIRLELRRLVWFLIQGLDEIRDSLIRLP